MTMWRRSHWTAALAVACLTAAIAWPVQGVVITQNVTLNWDPNVDLNDDQFLDSSLNRQNNRRIDFNGGAVVLANAIAAANDPGLPGAGKVVRLPVNGNGGTMESFNDFGLGDPSDEDGTFEVVFRVSDLAGKHAIFETGANGDGMALFIDGSTLTFQAQDGNNANQRATATATLGAGDVGRLIHAIGTIDLANDQVQLFVDGAPADSDTAPGTFDDWAGVDNTGYGRVNNDITGGSPGTFSAFDGDIAIVRFYQGKVLTAGEVANNFAFLQDPTGMAALNYVAADDPTPGDAVMDEINGLVFDNSNSRMNFALVGNASNNGSAYVFDGTGDEAQRGNFESGGTAIPGDPTNNSAAFEIVFNTADFADNDVLWEVGGTTDGSSLTLAGDTLQFVAKQGGATAGLAYTLESDDLGRFINVLGSIDLDDRELTLFIDGVFAGRTAFAGTDWAGTDAFGIAGQNGGAVGGNTGFFGNLNNYTNFEGQISEFRFYTMAFDIPEPATGLLLLVGASAIGLRRRRRA